jgi:hypothetical protein
MPERLRSNRQFGWRQTQRKDCMNDQQLAHLSVLTALNQMMTSRHFSICAVDDAAKALGTIPDGQAYKILRPLHCIAWQDMPRELRDAVPKLIERCLQVPAYQFQITEVTPEQSARIQAGTLKLLTR